MPLAKVKDSKPKSLSYAMMHGSSEIGTYCEIEVLSKPIKIYERGNRLASIGLPVDFHGPYTVYINAKMGSVAIELSKIEKEKQNNSDALEVLAWRIEDEIKRSGSAMMRLSLLKRRASGHLYWGISNGDVGSISIVPKEHAETALPTPAPIGNLVRTQRYL